MRNRFLRDRVIDERLQFVEESIIPNVVRSSTNQTGLVQTIFEILKGYKNNLLLVEQCIEMMKNGENKDEILETQKNLATQMQKEIVSILETLRAM